MNHLNKNPFKKIHQTLKIFDLLLLIYLLLNYYIFILQNEVTTILLKIYKY